MKSYVKRIIGLLLLSAFMGQSVAMQLAPRPTKSLSTDQIARLLEERKQAYKNEPKQKPVVTESRNKKALCKAFFSPKILIIVMLIASCYVILPMLDAIIPTHEFCSPLNVTNSSNVTSNAIALPNKTGPTIDRNCIMQKDEFLSSIIGGVRGYAPNFIVILIIGTASMIYSDMSAISPTPAVTLDRSVIGLDENVMQSIKTYIEVFDNPLTFKELGAKLPKALLLVGPAGTGKTLIARAIAGETKMAFFDAAATSFLHPIKIAEVFHRARKLKPCVLFIDEIDTIGAVKRGQQSSDSISVSKIALLNQLLVELGQENKDVMIIAATNYPDILDKALVRSGRFDNVVEIPKPGFDGRVKLLIHYIFKLPKIDFEMISPDFIEFYAQLSEGFTASDFENIVNQAALNAGKERKKVVDAFDMAEGFKIIAQNKAALAQTY